MQRHKSVEKRALTSKKSNLINRMGKSQIKTAVNKVLDLKDKENAIKALNEAVSTLDKSVKSGLIHKNKAANKKSKLYSIVNKLGK